MKKITTQKYKEAQGLGDDSLGQTGQENPYSHEMMTDFQEFLGKYSELGVLNQFEVKKLMDMIMPYLKDHEMFY